MIQNTEAMRGTFYAAAMAVLYKFPTRPEAAVRSVPKRYECPLGCQTFYAEHWELDAHMLTVHPGWMDKMAKRIISE